MTDMLGGPRGADIRRLCAITVLWVFQLQVPCTTASFSAGVKFNTDDLNDFLAPEQKCILPIQGAHARHKPRVPPPPGSVGAPILAATKRRSSGPSNSSVALTDRGLRPKKKRPRVRQTSSVCFVLLDSRMCAISGCGRVSIPCLRTRTRPPVPAYANATLTKEK